MILQLLGNPEFSFIRPRFLDLSDFDSKTFHFSKAVVHVLIMKVDFLVNAKMDLSYNQLTNVLILTNVH